MQKIIPSPKSYIEKEGVFKLGDDINVQSDFDLPILSKYANIVDKSNISIIMDSSIASEGYTVDVCTDSITVKASSVSGANYALVSIYKMGELALGNKTIPCCTIEDEPRYKWRGLQIDESRHFFGMATIKSMLDYMFLEKLNVFHWHLTDDQGWRIEIKKYPLLTEIGSKRTYSQVGGWHCLDVENKEHSGFYTQQQIKQIVDYAAERGIMVVPEIDFPAHCASALAAYKYLACREIDTTVPGYFGGDIPRLKMHDKHWNRTVCCGKESTFEFIFDVLDEVCELFDAPYLHMGGDEAPQYEWHQCPNCQKVMRDNSLKNEQELQGWFENRICEYLKIKGKKLIAWNDVLKSDNLNKDDKNVVIQYWTPKRDKRAEKYINCGGDAIMSNHQSFYFDMPYAQVPLDSTYNYTPANFGINGDNIGGVLGYEGELWSEWIPDVQKLQLSAFPRLQALGEVAWSMPEQINFTDFKKRLDVYKKTLQKQGINYAVDDVSMPKSKRQKRYIIKKFNRGNPLLEVELNKNFKGD